jgi:uncharacterized cupredoxin-like copper-binding protein
MRSARLPYVVLLVAAVAALAGSAAWAATRSSGHHLPWSGGRVAAACAPASFPGQVVRVQLISMGHGMMGGGMMGGGMMGGGGGPMRLVADRASLAAGRVSFVAQNTGGVTHEVVVLRLAAGQRAGERVIGSGDRVDEASSVGEASRSCAAGAGEGIRPGTAGWVTLDLKPGRYELVCNLKGHYRAGMYSELTVE